MLQKTASNPPEFVTIRPRLHIIPGQMVWSGLDALVDLELLGSCLLPQLPPNYMAEAVQGHDPMVIPTTYLGRAGCLQIGDCIASGTLWQVCKAVWQPAAPNGQGPRLVESTSGTPFYQAVSDVLCSIFYDLIKTEPPPPPSKPRTPSAKSKPDGVSDLRPHISSSSLSKTDLVVKFCIPEFGSRVPEDLSYIDCASMYRSFGRQQAAVLREARLYRTRLRPLQGTVVPRYYGLWSSKLLDGRSVFAMILEYIPSDISLPLPSEGL